MARSPAAAAAAAVQGRRHLRVFMPICAQHRLPGVLLLALRGGLCQCCWYYALVRHRRDGARGAGGRGSARKSIIW